MNRTRAPNDTLAFTLARVSRCAMPAQLGGSEGNMRGSRRPTGDGRGGHSLRPTANSTRGDTGVDSRSLVPPSSRKASELTIEALYASRAGVGADEARLPDDPPDESDRARLISDITRLIREPQMPETTRTAGLTLIGWLARRMPG